MSKYDDGIKNLLKFARMTEGIIALVPVLEKLGSIDAALVDTQGRLDKLRADETALKGKVTAAAEKLANAEQAATDAVAKGEADAAALVQAGKDLSETIISDAKLRADRIVAGANDQLSAAMGSVSEAKQLLAEVNAELDTATQKRDSMKSEIDALRARLTGE